MKLSKQGKVIILAFILLITSVVAYTVIKKNNDYKALLVVSPKDYELGENQQSVEKVGKAYHIINQPLTDIEGINQDFIKVIEEQLELSKESPIKKSMVIDWNATMSMDRYLNFYITSSIDSGTSYVYKKIYDTKTNEEFDLTDYITEKNLKLHDIEDYSSGLLTLNEESIIVGDITLDKETLEEILKEDYGTLKAKVIPPTPAPTPPTTSNNGIAPNGKKYIAFTFDDGPNPKTTPQVMDIAEQYNAKVTFFQLGQLIAKYPEVSADVVKRNHQLASHSYSHPKLTELSADAQSKEINDTENLIRNAGYTKEVMVRPPYGAFNDTLLSNQPKVYVNWNVDTLDWKSRNAEAVCNAIMKDAAPGKIILMHDIYQTTVDGFKCAIEKLSTQGYEFVTMETFFEAYGIQATGGKVYNSSKNK